MDSPRWPTAIMQHAFNPVAEEDARFSSRVGLIEPQGGVVKFVLEAYVSKRAERTMWQRNPLFPSK